MSATSDLNSTVPRHPVYWFEDGNLTIEVESQQFLLHRTLLCRHSGVLSKFADHDKISLPVNCKAEDFEALLECLYYDRPLRNDSPFSHAASVLRISSPIQLDFPYFYTTSRDILERMFSKIPVAFTADYPLSDALALATEFSLSSVRKAVLYSLVTTTNFDLPDIGLDVQKTIATTKDEANTTSPRPSDPLLDDLDKTASDSLSKEVTETCTLLLSRIIEHFTPILFTPATAQHMECTDMFAEIWSSMVMLPAINDNGVYKPLETLERLKGTDWPRYGLCASCIEEKLREWTDEQWNVWRLLEL